MNLSNGTFLAFGIGGTLSTIGNLAKPINVYNVGLTANAGISAAPVLVSSTVNLLGTLSITNTQPIVMNGAISGTSGIAKFGTSNLVLNAANNYTGPTVIAAGGLAIGTSGSIANSPLIQINSGTFLDVTAKPGGLPLAPGQTLSLGGSVLGDLTVASGSTLLGSGVFAGSLTVSPGRSATIRDGAAYGAIVVEGHGAVGNFDVETPSVIRFGQMTQAPNAPTANAHVIERIDAEGFFARLTGALAKLR